MHDSLCLCLYLPLPLSIHLPGHWNNKNNRSQGPLPAPKQAPLSQADTASARRNKDRQRCLEVKKAIRQKGDRFDAEKSAEGGGLWQTEEGSLLQPLNGDGRWGGGGQHSPLYPDGEGGSGYSPSLGPYPLLHGGDGVQDRIKRQASVTVTLACRCYVASCFHRECAPG